MSGDDNPRKQKKKAPLVLREWLTSSSSGEGSSAVAAGAGSGSSGSFNEKCVNEPREGSAGEKWAKYGAPNRGGRPRGRRSGLSDEGFSNSYTKAGRVRGGGGRVSVAPLPTGESGYNRHGNRSGRAVPTSSSRLIVDLAEDDPRYSRAAAAAAAVTANGNAKRGWKGGVVDLTGGEKGVVGVSRKRRANRGITRGGSEGGNGSADVDEMLLDLGVDSADTSDRLKELLVDLCEEQRHVLGLVLRGKSVFFTGAAGTGKSFLLKKLHKALDLVGKGETTFLTGTTGKAAVGIGGCTIHSFAGVGMGNQPIEDILGWVQSSKLASSRWRTCDVLVIDEISMMDGELFDKLNLVGQRVRGNSQPFGGIQLVLCGDFYQLPPVGIGQGSTRFCFEAETWDTSVDQSIVLKKVFRQKDPLFLNILHEMREGRVSREAQRILQEKVQQENSKVGVFEEGGGSCNKGSGAAGGGSNSASTRGPTYTRLFSRNGDVDRLNERELRKLPGESEIYKASDTGEPSYVRQLQNNCSAPSVLELKVGAKVLLLKNLDPDNQLVNGSTGVVVKLEEIRGKRYPVVEFDAVEGKDKVTIPIRHEEWTITLGKREVALRLQIPLRLAWALSVHKAQGMTIANVMVSTQGMFEFGQAYVALSRATTLEGLHLLDFHTRVVKAHGKVMAFYAALEGRALGGPSKTVTVIPRQGKMYGNSAGGEVARAVAAPKPGEWMSRRSSKSGTSGSFSSPGTPSRCSVGGDGGEISPAARERMEENRKRAMAKLAEKRAQAMQAAQERDRKHASSGV